MLQDLTPTQAAFLEARRRIIRVRRIGESKLDLSFLQILKIPPEIYNLASLRVVDLHRTSLSALPAEISQLESLQSLDLRGTPISTLPPEIGRLRSLESLNLAGTRISALPPEIGQLLNLLSLNLAGTPISALPPEIGRLLRLQSLNLAGTQVRALPPEIGELYSLQSLNLGNTRIRALPAEICQLQSLQSLHLAGTDISPFPAEIGQLARLESLDLTRAPISALPAEISLLRNLQLLNLQGTRIRTLPAEIGQLQSLKSLNGAGTPITDLPAEIGKLQSLQSLNLTSTRVSTLPAEIGQLRSLRSLNLGSTRITALPAELGALNDTLDLRLGGAPLQEPYPELIERGTPAVLAYLRSLADGESQYEAKLMLVGEGEVGKSTLIRRLRGEDFAEGLDTTHGIELGRLDLPHPQLDERIRLNSWDFGGQEVYRITHQFFFSRRSLYILVWKPRIGREQSEIEYWLNLLKLRVGDGARVLLVATHGDERPAELDYDALKRQFGALVAERPCVVDSKSGNGIDDLKAAVAVEAARLPQMGERISRRWLAIRQELERRGRDAPQITREAYDQLCREREMPRDQADTLGDLLHDLGQTVHYSQDLGLCDVVVLQPEWLTKAISYVLADPVARDRGGILDHARLREIWLHHGSPKRETYPTHHHRFFLRLMERFDICYRIEDQPQSLVGQLVPTVRPELPWDRTSPIGRQPELAVLCQLSQEAPGLVAWLTVRNHEFATGRHWRAGVFLAQPGYGAEALCELEGTKDLHIVVRGPRPDYLLALLRGSVEKLARDRWPGLRYEFRVPCPTVAADGIRCAGRFRLDHLRSDLEDGETEAKCSECRGRWPLSRLLMGFEPPRDPIDKRLDAIDSKLGMIGEDVKATKVLAAEGAEAVRALLNFASQEVTDCPRLFLLRPKDKRRWSPARVWESDYALTLCCEHPGHEHIWSEATYEITQSREWLQRAAPYISVVSKTLRVAVPIAGALAGTMMDQVTQKDLADEMKLMDRITGALPSGIDVDREAVEETEQLTRAQGEGLRALRQLLLELDKPRSFGSMRRVVTPSGDVLWICPEHYPEYDPGLPELPYDTAAS